MLRGLRSARTDTTITIRTHALLTGTTVLITLWTESLSEQDLGTTGDIQRGSGIVATAPAGDMKVGDMRLGSMDTDEAMLGAMRMKVMAEPMLADMVTLRGNFEAETASAVGITSTVAANSMAALVSRVETASTVAWDFAADIANSE